MAKKTKKKAAKKAAAKKSTDKKNDDKKKNAKSTKNATAKKPAAKKAAAKKKTSKKATGPKPVKTGKGAPVAEIANDFVTMMRAGAGDAAIWDKHFGKDLVSIEGVGMEMAFEGMAAVKAKCAQWEAANRIHSSRVEGPYIGATGFAVKYILDVEDVESGKRTHMEEVAVYSIKNGKVRQEEFMYYSPLPTVPPLPTANNA